MAFDVFGGQALSVFVDDNDAFRKIAMDKMVWDLQHTVF